MYTKQKHPGYKKVQGQSEAALQIGYVRPKTLISVEAKKLLIKNLHYLNDNISQPFHCCVIIH